MQVFLLSLIVFAFAVTGMSLGVILSNRPIRGSCGGLSRLRDAGGNVRCEGCTSTSPHCTGQGRHQDSDADRDDDG